MAFYTCRTYHGALIHPQCNAASTMTKRLSISDAALLSVAPLLWAGNAIVGHMVHTLVPPVLFNLMRWAIAFLILLPLAGSVFAPRSPLWKSWRRFAVLGLLGVGVYNALQYLALQTSTPINVTLVTSSMPVWMLLIGWLFFKAPVSGRQILGALISICGVLIVLCRGDWHQLLALRLVAGDLLMIVATICWSIYSWLLSRPNEPASIRQDWAQFMIAQVGFGLVWCALSASVEWSVSDARVIWGWPLAAALLYVATGPAIVAYHCWGAGVRRAGPNVAAFFNNLTPLFAAILSSAFLHELPRGFHVVAFALIATGIVLSSSK